MAKIRIESTKVVDVDLSSLNLDKSYQREERNNRFTIYKEFEPAAAGTLHVGKRSDGSLWLIDGQQRRWAMLQLKIKTWKAYIIDSSGPEYEAVIFNLLNGKNRMQLTARELFRAALRANDPVAISVTKAVEAAELRLVTNKGTVGWPYLSCVGGLYRLTTKHGEALVTRVLTVLARTWPQQECALKDLIPVGMINLFARQGDLIDDKRFVDLLSKTPPQKILNDSAVAVSNRHSATADVLTRLYNKGLPKRKRLKLTTDSDTTKTKVPDRAAREDQLKESEE